jgi:SAM-dependent methyltransferase
MDRESIKRKAEQFFEDLWSQGDVWNFETSPFERARFNALIALLRDRRYSSILEIGCGSGALTAELARLADHIVAIDISPTAIKTAQKRLIAFTHVSLQTGSIMEVDLRHQGPFDLIVLSETIYYLGWLHPFFDVAWLASELYLATSSKGRLLLANTIGMPDDYLLLPSIVRTYRDLFRNVGYGLESEHTFSGVKDDTAIEVLISLFAKRDA